MFVNGILLIQSDTMQVMQMKQPSHQQPCSLQMLVGADQFSRLLYKSIFDIVRKQGIEPRFLNNRQQNKFKFVLLSRLDA